MGGLHLEYRHRSKIYLVSFKSDKNFLFSLFKNEIQLYFKIIIGKLYSKDNIDKVRLHFARFLT